MSSAAITEDLVKRAHELTRHLSRPSPRLYWTHLLIPHSIGCVAFYLCGAAVSPLPWRCFAFICCVLLWYRSLAFIHEVVHFRPGTMAAFRTGWNALVGVPFLCPSFLYTTHLEHHSRTIYGTERDGEYIPWGVKPPAYIVQFLVASVFAPFLAAFRFAVLVPLTWMAPGLRSWVQEHASALVIHPWHRRQSPTAQQRREWLIQESWTLVWVGFAMWLGFSHRVSWKWFAMLAAVLACISLINAARTVLSHRFRNSGEPMTFFEQIQDSVNHADGGLFTELMCPVGLRYHALHHMLPSLPFHALPEAHRILMRELPENSAYRRTNSASLWSTTRVLWSDSSSYREAS
jgi:fatty acid desaturase